MKKIFSKIIFALLLIPMIFFASACGDGDETVQENVEYNVNVQSSDFYNVSNRTTKATAGLSAFVVINPKFDAVIIENVMCNGQECTLDDSIANRYNFTMPNEDANVTVQIGFVDNTQDNFLSWSNDNNYTFKITTDSEEEYYDPQYDSGSRFEAEVSSTPASSGGYFTSHNESVFSLDQNVVPNSALFVNVLTAPLSNFAIGFEVIIDRSQFL